MVHPAFKFLVRFSFLIAIVSILFEGCNPAGVGGGQPATSSSKDITAFSIVSPAATGTITGTSIAVTVPFGTNVTALVAVLTSTGASVKVGSTVQVSGTTANNFTSPVAYTVTAADSSTQTYTVTVTIAASSTTYTLTPAALANGTMTPTIAQQVTSGAATSITATPSTGYTFSGWLASPTANASFANVTTASTTVTLSGNATITPIFTNATSSYPIHLLSGSHPNPNLWYNDGLGNWLISWNKPFPDVIGYYYVLSTSPTGTPTPATGTFLNQQSYTAPAAALNPGSNYFHIVWVDPSSTVNTVDNMLQVQINTTPPAVASSSHPSQGTWYTNPNVYLSWTNPEADSNFTGYYYLLDHFANTVPTAATGTLLSVTQKQLLVTNLSAGVWVFHLVNIDTQGATTKTAAQYILYIGSNPGTGDLAGSVVDGASAPLGGVNIGINRGLFGAVSNSSGTYTFNNNLFAGTWEVTASKSGYSSQVATVTVNASQTTTQNFTLP